MKRFIYLIYFAFFVLMAFTFYMAFKVHDGLIEEHYYEKSTKYFDVKKKEDSLGLKVSVLHEPDGKNNELKVLLKSKEGVLTGAKVLLIREWIANKKEDKSFLLKEETPGIYITNVDFPHGGQWFMRLIIKHSRIETEKLWKIDIK